MHLANYVTCCIIMSSYCWSFKGGEIGQGGRNFSKGGRDFVKGGGRPPSPPLK